MIVDGAAAVRWPYFKDSHTSRTDTFMRKELQSNISTSFLIYMLKDRAVG